AFLGSIVQLQLAGGLVGITQGRKPVIGRDFHSIWTVLAGTVTLLAKRQVTQLRSANACQSILFPHRVPNGSTRPYVGDRITIILIVQSVRAPILGSPSAISKLQEAGSNVDAAPIASPRRAVWNNRRSTIRSVPV